MHFDSGMASGRLRARMLVCLCLCLCSSRRQSHLIIPAREETRTLLASRSRAPRSSSIPRSCPRPRRRLISTSAPCVCVGNTHPHPPSADIYCQCLALHARWLTHHYPDILKDIIPTTGTRTLPHGHRSTRCHRPDCGPPCVKWIRIDCSLRTRRSHSPILGAASEPNHCFTQCPHSPSPSPCSELRRCGASRSTRNMGSGSPVPLHIRSDPHPPHSS
ncbi:hypothetical protein B0H13DRAFT_106442 [Mycena leptocephala]|nr:hypothetical protein B0H13DRAFT_106442 [Mycena leptocephala]